MGCTTNIYLCPSCVNVHVGFKIYIIPKPETALNVSCCMGGILRFLKVSFIWGGNELPFSSECRNETIKSSPLWLRLQMKWAWMLL